MRKVNCPQCGSVTEYSEKNLHRPFCSERCKMIDLGDWAEEKFSVPSEEIPDEEDIEQALREQFPDSIH